MFFTALLNRRRKTVDPEIPNAAWNLARVSLAAVFGTRKLDEFDALCRHVGRLEAAEAYAGNGTMPSIFSALATTITAAMNRDEPAARWALMVVTQQASTLVGKEAYLYLQHALQPTPEKCDA